ncbi:hypothetical protein Misp01_18720 [Microtetraspora sp. NBRC 13810]|uniref:hypothetical protein n=1 Tax=Microtetraspora sp. NBRC 13810 TaxID=3030990 RepID=UPI0024A3DDC8|nr:hypothetical protein [Microtetraspora sp. NBRC 13810]GLW06742.1 hypothetical protein Misp01_18720 [Microtetraspora sp. NBRC 13810]
MVDRRPDNDRNARVMHEDELVVPRRRESPDRPAGDPAGQTTDRTDDKTTDRTGDRTGDRTDLPEDTPGEVRQEVGPGAGHTPGDPGHAPSPTGTGHLPGGHDTGTGSGHVPGTADRLPGAPGPFPGDMGTAPAAPPPGEVEPGRTEPGMRKPGTDATAAAGQEPVDRPGDEIVARPADTFPSASAPRDGMPRDGMPRDGMPRDGMPRDGGADRDGMRLIAQDPDELLRRWHDVQVAFVDDPRSAVERADRLLDEVVKSVTESLNRQEKKLHDRWQGAGEHDTERLRLTLRDYRTTLERLLELSDHGKR